jgi:hypothetical protein
MNTLDFNIFISSVMKKTNEVLWLDKGPKKIINFIYIWA